MFDLDPLMPLFAHYFQYHAFGALAVELSVIDLLPRSEIELAGGHRHDHLVMHQQALQVRIPVRLAGLVMAIVLAEGRQVLQPLVDIGDQAVFGVVYPDAGRDMHRRNQDHAFLDAAFLERPLHLWGNIDVLAVFRSAKGQIFGMEAHQSDDTPGAEKAPAAARILVVDDEQQLLKILTRYLARLGYGVVAASSTEEAWEHIQASPESYALALIDATMPGMTAEELTTRILRVNPVIRVIACSGYPITREEFASLDPERVSFLHKPFSPDTLAAMVRGLLGE
jgi:CheY-like chemotaxis protein